MALSVAIHGAAGRMGKRLVACCMADKSLQLAAALDHPKHPEIGKDSGLLAGERANGVPLSATWQTPPQAVIDFSVPAAADAIRIKCVEEKVPLVVATTGLTAEQKDAIREAAKLIPIVWSPSMSTTVNLAMKLVSLAGTALRDIASGVDVEIVERHHRMKEDSPSGTALRFGEIVATAMGQTQHQHGREGMVGKRPLNEIGYHAVRTGDNPGEHTIIFGLLGETLEVTVRASNRDCYALGALTAAKFLAGKANGLYSMFDVLNLGPAV